MSATIVLDRELVVRFGHINYQYHNMLDNRSRIQLMNQETGEFKVMDMADFCSRLRTGQLVPTGNRDKSIFGSDGFPQSVVVDLSALADNQRETLDLRVGFVKYVRKKGVTQGQRSKLEKVIPTFLDSYNAKRMARGLLPVKGFGVSTGMSWIRKYVSSGFNAAALLSGNGFRRCERRVSPVLEEVMEWALDKYYLQRSRFTLQYTVERVRERLKQEVAQNRLTAKEARCSYATLQRREKELDPYTVLKRRYGSAYAKRELRYTIDGTTVPRAMARLEVDHAMLNWVVVCDRTQLPLGRPTLTVIVDSYSGYIVGLYVSFNGPGLTSVLKAMKNAIRPKGELTANARTDHPWIAFGVGDCFLLDNGMEFHSKGFQLAAWELGTDLEYCAVRMPWLKPHVERCFADLDYLPVGQGRVYKPVAGMLNLDPKRDAVITLSALCRGLIIFAADIHARQPNRRTLALPFDLYQESMESSPPPRVPVTDAGLDLIAAMSRTRVVTGGGAEWEGLVYAGPHLGEMIRSAGGKFDAMTKLDPDNVGAMYVQHPRTQEWVLLTCTRPDYANQLTVHQHRLIKKTLRNSLKEQLTIEGLAKAKLHLVETWLEPLARKNAPISPDEAKQYARHCASARASLGASDNDTPPASAFITTEDLKAAPTVVPDFDVVMFA